MYIYDIVRMEALTSQVTAIHLLPSTTALNYIAGQYVNVLHKDKRVSPLSIACSPKENHELEFQLYHPPENHKAQDLLKIAREEKKWQLEGPFGTCTSTRIINTKPLILIARGSAFSPVKAIIEALFISSPDLPIHFYWSVATQEDFYLLPLIETWRSQFANFIFTPVVSKIDDATISTTATNALPEIILRDHQDLSASQVYASGPRVLVHALFYALQKQGLQQAYFYSDMFG